MAYRDSSLRFSRLPVYNLSSPVFFRQNNRPRQYAIHTRVRPPLRCLRNSSSASFFIRRYSPVSFCAQDIFTSFSFPLRSLQIDPLSHCRPEGKQASEGRVINIVVGAFDFSVMTRIRMNLFLLFGSFLLSGCTSSPTKFLARCPSLSYEFSSQCSSFSSTLSFVFVVLVEDYLQDLKENHNNS